LVLWDEVALEVSKEFFKVKWEKELVDAMTVRMVKKPQTIDTVVGTNLHMDILSDLASALTGSIGIAPSSNLDPERNCPSMFEPVHGSAFDIVGKGLANPVGAIGFKNGLVRSVMPKRYLARSKRPWKPGFVLEIWEGQQAHLN